MPKCSHRATDLQNNHMISNFLWSSRKNEAVGNWSETDTDLVGCMTVCQCRG